MFYCLWSLDVLPDEVKDIILELSKRKFRLTFVVKEVVKVMDFTLMSLPQESSRKYSIKFIGNWKILPFVFGIYSWNLISFCFVFGRSNQKKSNRKRRLKKKDKNLLSLIFWFNVTGPFNVKFQIFMSFYA